jgi:protein-tyrosine phosphatase
MMGAGSCATAATPRLEGARNFRDVGGYAARDGLAVRRGRIFRSAGLDRLTAGDVAALDRLAIVAVFDLRSGAERRHAPSAWSPGPHGTYVFRSGRKRPLIDMAAAHPTDLDGALALMDDFYRELPVAMGHAFSEIVARIGVGDSPCLIHCSAGKDRTGVAVAILLTALGVARETVVEDYVRSSTIEGLAEDMARALLSGGDGARLAERYAPDALAAPAPTSPNSASRCGSRVCPRSST